MYIYTPAGNVPLKRTAVAEASVPIAADRTPVDATFRVASPGELPLTKYGPDAGRYPAGMGEALRVVVDVNDAWVAVPIICTLPSASIRY